MVWLRAASLDSDLLLLWLRLGDLLCPFFVVRKAGRVGLEGRLVDLDLAQVLEVYALPLDLLCDVVVGKVEVEVSNA